MNSTAFLGYPLWVSAYTAFMVLAVVVIITASLLIIRKRSKGTQKGVEDIPSLAERTAEISVVEAKQQAQLFRIGARDKVVSAIEEVKQARFEQGVHMATEHTLKQVQDGVPFSDFLFRGLAAGAQHDKNHTQTDELMEKAAQAVAAARVKGRNTKPDEELGNELYEYVKEAAAELGLEAPPLL